MVGRLLTAPNIQWNRFMQNFKEQFKALKDKNLADNTDIPIISKAIPIIKWTKAMLDLLHRVIEVRMIPLVNVVQELVFPPAAAPALEARQPSYHDDNAKFYYKLE